MSVQSSISEVSIDVRGRVAILSLNRAVKRNALSLRMWQEMPRILEAVAAEPTISALVVVGSGEHFSAGADIGEFKTVRSTEEGMDLYRRAVDTAERKLSSMDKPTIAMVRGYCIGGGLEIALACDFRFASKTAKLGITASKLGIVYGVPSTRRLASVVGPTWAKYILFSAKIFDAVTADKFGLITELVDDAQLEDVTFEFAELLASRSRITIAASKAVIDQFGQIDWLESPDLSRFQREAVHSDYYQDAVTAFNEKTLPREAGEHQRKAD